MKHVWVEEDRFTQLNVFSKTRNFFRRHWYFILPSALEEMEYPQYPEDEISLFDFGPLIRIL